MPPIRDPRPDDRPAWEALWQDYLTFYGIALPPSVTDRTWARIMDPGHRMKMRLALGEGDAPAGFAIHHWHDTTWSDRPDMYLEDLYVAGTARGQGLGRALLDDLIAIGRRMGCGRMYWITDEGNATARRLYDRYATTDGDIRYRMPL
jgi:GNAT superfamily N-acetyltransferase